MDEISISTPTPVRNNTKRSYSEEEKPTMKQESVHFQLFCENFPSNGISTEPRRSMDKCTSKTLRMRSYSVFNSKDDRTSPCERKKQIEELLEFIHQHSRPSSEKDTSDTLSDTSLLSSEEHTKRAKLNKNTLQNMNEKQLNPFVPSYGVGDESRIITDVIRISDVLGVVPILGDRDGLMQMAFAGNIVQAVMSTIDHLQNANIFVSDIDKFEQRNTADTILIAVDTPKRDKFTTCKPLLLNGKRACSSWYNPFRRLAAEDVPADNYTICKYCNKLLTEIEEVNSHLLRVLKQRQHQENRRNSRYNTITAVLQAISHKTSNDSKLRFSFEPINTVDGQREWLLAMKAIIRLPQGIPDYFRQKLWSVLAENHLNQTNKDWKKTLRTTLCERVMDSDEMIHSQIIKDLHRTGWEEFHDEKKLKQLLLAYARYNKDIGYCQGFNVIGALILHVVDYSVEESLKILIYLVEDVLPNGYFDHSLRALSVDMAVIKDLLLQRLPNSMKHLEMLQKTSGNEYEPALVNVFSMHWLLTLYATCLPRHCVYRIWDAVMLEGSEVLLRTSIAIWSKISRKVLATKSADQFYMTMGKISQSLLIMSEKEQNSLIKMMYTMADFPYPGLYDLREKHTWNIHPLSTSLKLLQNFNEILSEESDTEEITSCSACTNSASSRHEDNQTTKNDLTILKKQFKQLQRQHKLISIPIDNSFYQFPVITMPTRKKFQPNEIFNHLHIHPLPSKQLLSVSGGHMTLTSTPIQPKDNAARTTFDQFNYSI